jgi:hypothetical protein
MSNPNLQLLTDAARLLGPILGELVFVGGCATALLITDNAADVRPTFDVDAIVPAICSAAACSLVHPYQLPLYVSLWRIGTLTTPCNMRYTEENNNSPATGSSGTYFAR